MNPLVARSRICGSFLLVTVSSSALFSFCLGTWKRSHNAPGLTLRSSIDPLERLSVPPFCYLQQCLCTRNSLAKQKGYIVEQIVGCPGAQSVVSPIPPECRIQYLITYARKTGRRNVWLKSSKAALKCISFIASNLGVLPEPLDFVIREYGGGNGGGAWFRKGFGGNGWSRRGRKLGFLGILVICALGFLLLVLGKEFETGLGLGILGMSVLWFSIRGQNKGLKDCTLGFCVCAAMVILGPRRGELQRWIDGSCVRSSTMEIVARMRRGRRRAM